MLVLVLVIMIGATTEIIAFLPPGSTTPATTSLWPRQFFDHVPRSSESYSEKWNCVFENPVRAGFVAQADDWPYAGEIETLML